MARPPILAADEVAAWLAAHAGWSRDGDVLVRSYTFRDFAGALAFAVRVGLHAERADHHPELTVTWGRATVRTTTHDPPGLTRLDLACAEAADGAYSP